MKSTLPLSARLAVAAGFALAVAGALAAENRNGATRTGVILFSVQFVAT